jgi:NADP-dependent 3-hydroxy acid dehydrogenase YdfG
MPASRRISCELLSIDALVNNAGIFFTKPFTDYTTEDINSLVSTNVHGFLNVTQLAIKQMLAQNLWSEFFIAGSRFRTIGVIAAFAA